MSCNPPCIEGRGVCDSDTLTCLCGWEFGTDDCSKTFYEIIGKPYLIYSLYSITLSSIIFGISSLVLEKSIEWKVAKLERPQKASLFILSIGSLGRILFYIVSVSGFREKRARTPILPFLFILFIIGLICSFVLVILLWVELWISITKTKRINTLRARRIFYCIIVIICILAAIQIIAGVSQLSAVRSITIGTIVFVLAITSFLTLSFLIFGACNARHLSNVLRTFKGRRRAIVFNRVSLFTSFVSLFLFGLSLTLGVSVGKGLTLSTDTFLDISYVTRTLEFLGALTITLNYLVAVWQWKVASSQSESGRAETTKKMSKSSTTDVLVNEQESK